MIRRKKEGKKDNKESEEASTKATDTSQQKKDSNVSFGDVQEMYQPPIFLQAPSNSTQNVAEKKGENDDDGKAEDAVYATKHHVLKIDVNASEKTTIKDNENSPIDNRAEGSSKKKRKRHRGKSTLDNSGSKNVASAKHGAHKSNSSKRHLNKDKDGKLECDNKALYCIKDICKRISEIESNADESRTLFKKPTVVKKLCSPSEKEKRKVTLCTKEEKRRFFSNDYRNLSPIIRFKDSDINIPLRPIIIVTDKATQTDPALEPPSTSEPTDGKNSTIQKSDSETSVKSKQKESTLQFPVKESKLENASEHTDTFQNKTVAYSNASSCVETLQNVSNSKTLKNTVTKPEPPDISESTDLKNSTTVKSDSDGSVVNKPNESTLRFTAEEIKPKNVSADTSTFKNKNESFSNLSSSVKVLQSLISTITSKSTAPEPPSISKSTDGKNSDTLKSDSDSSVVIKPIEPALHFSDEEAKSEKVSEDTPTFQNKNESFSNLSFSVKTLQSLTSTGSLKSSQPEPPSISKSTDGINSATLESDPDISVINKPIASASYFPAEELKPENVSEDSATFVNKINSLFNMDLHEENLQSMTEELLRNTGIISKDLEGFNKSLRRSK